MPRQIVQFLAFGNLLLLGSAFAESPRTTAPVSDGAVTHRHPKIQSPSRSLDNLLQITDSVYCGGEPQTKEAFVSLVKLGVKTVVSVDGARPDVRAARQHGLRYVHIPIGYDGIDNNQVLSLARLVNDAKRPYYFHCHHGRHRGPAAAVVACMIAGEIHRNDAMKMLERAGTSKKYAGLWAAVQNHEAPAADALLPQLVEVAEVDSLTTAMVKVDRAYDKLQLCRDNNWNAPVNHPDLNPHQQALLLKEALHEAHRHLADFDREFKEWLSQAETFAQNIEDALAGNAIGRAIQNFKAVSHSCSHCHNKYRN